MSKKHIPPATFIQAIKYINNGLTVWQASEKCYINGRTLTSHLEKLERKSIMSADTSKIMQREKKLKRLKTSSKEISQHAMKVCVFCGRPEEREAELGKFHVKSKVSVHYYCLLFSCALEQNGEDDEGILGFLQKDIIREVQRGRKLKCVFCLKTGATIGCNSKCKASYHFPCGLDNNAQYVFSGNFSSFCVDHRKYQIAISIGKADCPICMEPLTQDPKHDVYPPCCKRAWFHKLCLKKLALSAGYFFKCPLCNDNKDFVTEMLTMGVYVPEQDASWEKEPNAFAELLERPIHCDAEVCICADGRDFDGEKTIWEIVLCALCGSTGTHLKCAALRLKDTTWECSQCVGMLKGSQRVFTPAKHCRPGRYYPRKKRKYSTTASMGESSGLPSEASSIAGKEEWSVLPSLADMDEFADRFPSALLDAKVPQMLRELVPTCQLNLFGAAISQFRASALKNIQRLILYQIYKPLSLWLHLKKSYLHRDVVDPAEEQPSMEDMLRKMAHLVKQIDKRISEANNSTEMAEFKITSNDSEEPGSSRFIRYGNVLFSVNRHDRKWRSVSSFTKECHVLLEPLSQLQIEQWCSPPKATVVSSSANSFMNHFIRGTAVEPVKSMLRDNVPTASDVKENIGGNSPAKFNLSVLGTSSLPLGDKCLNTKSTSTPMPFFLNKISPKTAVTFRRKHHKSKDTKKYIQLSISDFLVKK